GIRDWSVTGVQTCALPIFGDADPHRVVAARCVRVLQRLERALDVSEIAVLARERGDDPVDLALREQSVAFDDVALDLESHRLGRSEERRVGKECGLGWAAE